MSHCPLIKLPFVFNFSGRHLLQELNNMSLSPFLPRRSQAVLVKKEVAAAYGWGVYVFMGSKNLERSQQLVLAPSGSTPKHSASGRVVNNSLSPESLGMHTVWNCRSQRLHAAWISAGMCIFIKFPRFQNDHANGWVTVPAGLRMSSHCMGGCHQDH